MLDDDELGEQLLSLPEQESRERVAEWSRGQETMTQILEAIRGLTAAVIAVAGAKPPHIQPAARPVTSLDRARFRRGMAQHRSLVQRLTPDEG
jgi:hypothetical protein